MTTRHTHRRGLAPLELVMIFPLLITLVMGVLWVGKAGSARAAAITDARGVAWKKRDDAKPGKVLKLNHDATVSVVEDARANPLPGRDTFAGRERVAEAVTGAPFNPWAFDMIEFKELPPARQEITPHRELLTQIGRRNPDSLALYNRLIGRLGPAPIDPAKNAEVQKVRRPAELAAAQRGALQKSMLPLAAAMGPAIPQLESLAASDPFLAWWYEYEALVVVQGINGATQLSPALTPPK